ncbi:MAG: arsenite methyltransferase [Planctomycetota bacterium]|jgi:SAM-dependent methyltransferase
MSTEQTIRDRVSADYAHAVTSDRPCCGSREQKGIAVQYAGYTPEELESVPDDAVVNAFGCGNPVAISRLRPGDTVVDLGSGAGIDLMLAARAVGPGGRVIGVDMTDAMNDHARANIEASGLANVEVRKGLIERLPVENASVDWVISNCVVNLSPEKPRVFAEIARVLKPGARVTISDIVVKDLPDWIKDDPALLSGCVGGAIDEEAYAAGLRAAGLVDVTVTGRYVYEIEQLAAVAGAGDPEPAACCHGPAPDTPARDAPAADHDRRRRVAEALAGRVWSAVFTARKPARAENGAGQIG